MRTRSPTIEEEKELLSKLGKFRPCDWGVYSRYFYVKKTGKLPPICERCRKIELFFDENSEFERMQEKCKESVPRVLFLGSCLKIFDRDFTYKQVPKIGGGILVIVYIEEKTEKESESKAKELQTFFSKLIKENNIKCRVLIRKAGRYWQDMFPELFEKTFENYKPFYKDYYDFRKEADKLPEEKIKEMVKKEILELEELYKLFNNFLS